ncbi:MAG: hypothetical protein A3E01_00075 [Gammaproteobacteria bacterium RIFCSPHIGHO2_12_FULL_63_22]|nr:MAG: hypothetical protein A3E01_00075 [Gammaproteobacteria bacterium RIFCSPHIGHO2_12_FULL_63_22]
MANVDVAGLAHEAAQGPARWISWAAAPGKEDEMPSKVFMICNSYESGYGHGLANDGLDLSKTPHADPELGEAYQIGYEAGQEAQQTEDCCAKASDGTGMKRKRTMIYEEAIVDGVLCWRNSPRDCKGHGSWVPKTPQELTAMLMEARRASAVIPPMRLPFYGPGLVGPQKGET